MACYQLKQDHVVIPCPEEKPKEVPKEAPKEQPNNPSSTEEFPVKGTAVVKENSYVGKFKIAGIGIGLQTPAETKDLGGVRDNKKSDSNITRTTGELTIGPVTIGHEGVSDKKNDVSGVSNGQNAEANNYVGIGPYQYTRSESTQTGAVTEKNSLEIFSFEASFFGTGIEINITIDLPSDTAGPDIRRLERDNSYCGGCGNIK
jgi:hypothetical protein